MGLLCLVSHIYCRYDAYHNVWSLNGFAGLWSCRFYFVFMVWVWLIRASERNETKVAIVIDLVLLGSTLRSLCHA